MIPAVIIAALSLSRRREREEISAARTRGVYLQVCHNKRFEYGFQRIKELLDTSSPDGANRWASSTIRISGEIISF
jgi:hypothetical protein